MSTALTVVQPETKLHGAVIRGALSVHLARFELEPDRVVVYQHSRWLFGFGLLGVVLSRKLRGKRAFDLELSKIAVIGRGKFGRNKKVLEVTMSDGTQHRFSLDDAKSARIREHIGQRARLVEAGEERWQVLPAGRSALPSLSAQPS